ncbi:MAG: aminoglycoside phosphotransferase family protein [Maribacter sp.]|nr:aminoglycoside phosphotransferase family protein [Maribacter sp.]
MGSQNKDTISTILQHFCVAKKRYDIETINNGYINDTFMVLEKEHPLYVLQRINHSVFGNINGIMANINNALLRLNDAQYEKIELIKTIDNQAYYENEDGFWRLMSYINQTTTYNTTQDANIAFEAGRIIGKFHQLMEGAHQEDYIDTIPYFHNLELREKQFRLAKANADITQLEVANEALLFVEKILAELKVLNQAELPVRICHNDTKLNNILFSTATDKALCLIDLDTIMKGYFYCDFGDAVRTVVNTALEDEKELHKITFEKKLFEAFVDGLASNGSLLSQEEIDSLPLGAVFMPFIHGLRALTDFLNKNIYYKVTYENQNYDRCLSLFDFTQKAMNELDYMQKVVSGKLN